MSVPSAPARRRRLTLAGASWRTALVVALLAYGVLVTLFMTSGQTEPYGEARVPDGGALLVVSPIDVNASDDLLDVLIRLVPSSKYIDDDRTLTRDLLLTVGPTAGSQSVTYSRDDVPAVTQVSLLTDGDIEAWPLDRYTAGLSVALFEVTPQGRQPVPLTFYVDGNVVGWKFTARAPAADEIPPAELPPEVVLVMRRAGATLTFGAILVSVLVVLPVLSLFVSIAAYRGRRKVEPTLASWMAAMLFATVPLRNFLPGSPPPGSWIDVTVVLWVVVALVASLAVYVAAWWRQGTAYQPPFQPPSHLPSQPLTPPRPQSSPSPTEPPPPAAD